MKSLTKLNKGFETVETTIFESKYTTRASNPKHHDG